MKRFGVVLGLTTVSIGMALFGPGCGGSGKPPTDAERVEQTISRLQTGEVIEQLEAANPKAPANQKLLNPSSVARDSLLGLPAGTTDKPEAKPDSKGDTKIVDPCPNAPIVADTAPLTEQVEALRALGTCFRDLVKPFDRAEKALSYLRIFSLPAGVKPLSEMTEAELEAFQVLESADLFEVFGEQTKPELIERRKRLRSSFSDEDLVELLKIAGRRRTALATAEAAIYVATDLREPMVKTFSKVLSRYALLLELRDSFRNPTGRGQVRKIAMLLAKVGMKVSVSPELATVPNAILHPYMIRSMVPIKGMETSQLSPELENPFSRMSAMLATLGGSQNAVMDALSKYSTLRGMDNPPIPSHPASAPDAAQVVIFDSGVDFRTIPELGTFLSAKTSRDFADLDGNPWMPAYGSYSHGSATAGTLLSIVAHQAPEVLRERKLELGVWKTDTIRDFLAGTYVGKYPWYNRLSAHEGTIEAMKIPAVDQPKIVSVSLGFRMVPFLGKIGAPDHLMKMASLWVMAAGNSGTILSESEMESCFSDIDPSKRPNDRILCVGAISKGLLDDQIASYSNWGAGVDVYAYESYQKLCPNGTSCSTPAVAGAAAVIAAKFPTLKPEQIKTVIVDASEVREMEFEQEAGQARAPKPSPSPSTSPGPTTPAPVAAPAPGSEDEPTPKPERLKIRFFDPVRMLDRALEIAAKMAGPQAPAKPAVISPAKP